MAAERGRHATKALLLFLLLAFALAALLTSLFGVRMYRSISEGSDANYALRASLTYVSGKVHALDSEGFLSTKNMGGTDVLVMAENIEGIVYNTYIYLYDGRLCELYADESFEFDPAAGTALVEVASFTFAVEGDALRLTATAPSGETRSCRTLLRSYAGGVR